MKNALIVFPYQVNNKEDFEAIITDFEQKGFDAYIIGNLNPEEFDYRILPVLLKDLSVDPEKDRIVIMSNAMDLILIWFRCYNCLIDDFAFFIDNQPQIFCKMQPGLAYFFNAILNFNGIENDPIEGKIFINITPKNYHSLFHFLFTHYNFQYFNSLVNFTYDKQKLQRQHISKAYHYNEQVQYFPLEILQGAKVQHLFLTERVEPSYRIDDTFKMALDSSPFFIIFFFIEFYKSKTFESIRVFIPYLEHIYKTNPQICKELTGQMMEYINRDGVAFPEKVYFLTLMVILHTLDDILLQYLFSFLLNDTKYILDHYSILISTFFYRGSCGLPIYSEYHQDCRKVFQRIVNSLPCSLPKQVDKKRVHIAFIVDQLLAIKHSPTKFALDYALEIKKMIPDCHIKIFVEDNYFNRSSQVRFYEFSSVPSHQLAETHLGYLGSPGVEIYYSDTRKTKIERTQELINEVVRYAPEIIFSTSVFSLSTELLYPNYPIVFMSLGAINYITSADVYLYSNLAEIESRYLEDGLIDINKIHEFKWGLDLPSPIKQFARSDLGLKENDFVLITVGNRLDGEIVNEYVDCISLFLYKTPNAKWLIVGKAELNYLKTAYRNLVDKQITFIEYENDLSGLYTICDAFINPPRHGGGYSIAMAMNQGLPIVILNQASDGKVYVGSENCVGENWNDYLAELDLLYQDKNYRSRKGLLMKERVKQFSIRNSVQILIDYFKLAKQRFQERTM